MPRSRYDAATRDHAVKLATQVGQAEAARRTAIPIGTICSWMSRAGAKTCNTVASDQTRNAVATHQANMAERRVLLADALLAIAEKAVGVELAKIQDAKLYEIVGSRTRAIHDHQLLVGAATDRTETMVAREAAEQTLDELKQRRAVSA